MSTTIPGDFATPDQPDDYEGEDEATSDQPTPPKASETIRAIASPHTTPAIDEDELRALLEDEGIRRRIGIDGPICCALKPECDFRQERPTAT